MMLNSVLIGDLHLDGMSATLGADANRLQIAEVAKAEAWAVRNDVNHVVYLGDVGDKHTLSYDAHCRLVELWRTNTHLRRDVILGNHDFAENGVHSLSLLQRMAETDFEGSVHIHTEPTQVVLGGVTCNFLPYPYPKTPAPFEVSDAVNFAHFEVKGSLRDNGTPSPSGCAVVKDNNLWCLGHLHTPHELPNVHYVGTLYQRNFGEGLPKSFTHLKARMKDGVLQTKITRHDSHPSFRLINLDVGCEKDLDEIDSNPLYLYKILKSAAVRLPDTFLVKHPNVVRVEVYRTLGERTAIEQRQIVDAADDGTLNVYDGVLDYLADRHNYLTEAQIQRASEILLEIQDGC